ncbi:MAG: DUF4097 domain-containing protein [bacterium]|nr:DUF4097 domain-containing protein [bacterium]
MRFSNRTVICAIAVVGVLLASGVAAAANKTSHTERTFDASDIDKVVVDVSFHSVNVDAVAGSNIDVTIDLEFGGSSSKAERLLAEYEPTFKVVNGTLTIKSTREGRSSWNWFSSSRKKGKVQLYLPSGIDLVVDSSSGKAEVDGDFGDATVVCDTSSGSVEFAGGANEVRADTSSGTVRVNLTRRAEVVWADTSSGSVFIEGPAADVSADTSSGSIKAHGLLGDGNFDTSSGSVQASWDEAPAGSFVRADTSSGGVTLTFPEGTQLKGLVDTSSGGIDSDFPGEYSDRGHRLKLRADGPAVKVSVDTSSGGVKIHTN